MTDSLLITMKKDHSWFFFVSVIYGILFTFCLYKNMSGITFPILVAGLLFTSTAFLNKINIKIHRTSIPYFAGIFLLGISTCLTANEFFHFFNYVGIILLFMASMVHQVYDDKEWGFAEYAVKFFILAGMWISSVAEPFKGKILKKDKEKQEGLVKNKNFRAVMIGILMAVLFFIVVMPLLMMSDRIFSSIFQNIFRVFDFRSFLYVEKIWDMFGVFLTFLVGMISLYAFFAGLFKKNLNGNVNKKIKKYNSVTGITFTAILAAVYVLYSGIQILFLFLRIGDGLPDGMTYSQYAHEGFWQLLFVSIINFAVVVFCMQIFSENRILRILLCIVSVCTCVMILSAAYRMLLYVGEYDLTFLRVLVLWFLLVLMFIFLGVIYNLYSKKFRLFRYIMTVVSIFYIGFSFSHVDSIIASYNISKMETMDQMDVGYLIYGLSDDAAPEIAKLDKENLRYKGMVESVDLYFAEIHSEESSWRTWNLSRQQAKTAAEKWLESGNR